MAFLSDKNRAYDELQTAGIAFCERDGFTHVGLLCRDGEEVLLCHLQSHHRLDCQPIKGSYFWDDCRFLIGDGADSAPAVQGFIIAVGRGAVPIPYGFRYAGNPFDEQGIYKGTLGSKGLTCATFVMAIFEHLNFPIIDRSTWKNRLSDKSWQKKMLKNLEDSGHKDHANSLRDELGARRFRPEEVAVAGAAERIPVSFEAAVAMSKELLNLVRRAG